MLGRTGPCGLGCSTIAKAAVDSTSYGPEVGSGTVGCVAAASSAGSLIAPNGRIGIWVSVAANDARGAGNMNVIVDCPAAILTPRSAAARVGSLASGESAKCSVAATSATVIGVPLDHSRFAGRTTV